MTNTLELLQRHRKTIYLKKFSFPNSIWHRGLSPVWLLVPALAFGGSGRFQDGSIKLECFHDLSRVPFAFALGDIPGISPIRSKHVQNIFRNFGQFQPILNHLGDPDGEVRVLASVLRACHQSNRRCGHVAVMAPGKLQAYTAGMWDTNGIIRYQPKILVDVG